MAQWDNTDIILFLHLPQPRGGQSSTCLCLGDPIGTAALTVSAEVMAMRQPSMQSEVCFMSQVLNL